MSLGAALNGGMFSIPTIHVAVADVFFYPLTDGS